MNLEIERKFLVRDDGYKLGSRWAEFRQGYLCPDPHRTVRVRTYDGRGFITVKGKVESISREEYEYEIPAEDAGRMLDNLCLKPLIEKRRYFAVYKGLPWIVDEFSGANSGLAVAEIELDSEEQEFDRPDWLGVEVTGDSRYFNSNLVNHPYREWR